MKALFVLLLPVLCAFIAYSQNSSPEELTATPPRHQAGDFYIGATPVYYNNSVVNSSGMAIGIKSKIYLGNRVSFDGDLVLSEDYWHMAIGFLPICLNFLFQLTDDEVSILLLLFSFGQLAIHFPIANQAEISPYVGLGRYSNIADWEDMPKSTEINSFVIGVELNRYCKQFVVSPFVEYSHFYRKPMQSIQFGVYLAYDWHNKHNKQKSGERVREK